MFKELALLLLIQDAPRKIQVLNMQLSYLIINTKITFFHAWVLESHEFLGITFCLDVSDMQREKFNSIVASFLTYSAYFSSILPLLELL